MAGIAVSSSRRYPAAGDCADVDSVVDVEADLECERMADEHVVSDNVAKCDPREVEKQKYKYYTRER